MEIETMKIQKTFFVVALTAACGMQPMFGVQTASTTVKVLDATVQTTQKYWKPVAATVAVVGLGCWLWSQYGQERQENNKKPITVAEGFKDLKSLLEFDLTPLDTIKNCIAEFEKKGILIDVLTYNNNQKARVVDELETIYAIGRTKIRIQNSQHYDNIGYMIDTVYPKYIGDIAKMNREILLKK